LTTWSYFNFRFPILLLNNDIQVSCVYVYRRENTTDKHSALQRKNETDNGLLWEMVVDVCMNKNVCLSKQIGHGTHFADNTQILYLYSMFSVHLTYIVYMVVITFVLEDVNFLNQLDRFHDYRYIVLLRVLWPFLYFNNNLAPLCHTYLYFLHFLDNLTHVQRY